MGSNRIETEGGTAEEAPASVNEALPTLGQLKEVRDLCRNQADNGSFPTLAALIAGFSLGVLPTLKYYDVQDNYARSVQNPMAVTEGCVPCAYIDHTFLAILQAVFLGLTGILSSVSMAGFFLVFWKGRKILSSLAYLDDSKDLDDSKPDQEDFHFEFSTSGTKWKESVKAGKPALLQLLSAPPSERYIIRNQIYNFLKFWARCDVGQKVLQGAFWSSLITLMLSSAVSPHLYCFSCNLGIFMSSLMVFGCLIVMIVVLLPVFNDKTKTHTKRAPAPSPPS